MNIISLRNRPELLGRFCDYFTSHWASPESEPVYRDCMTFCLQTDSPLPQWYLLFDDAENIIGGAGLVTNDFISRMDLMPWLCALYVEESHRGHGFGSLLIDHIRNDCSRLGFESLYLSTSHIGYYEKYGFEYIGEGFHPWGEKSRIYKTSLSSRI